MTHWYDKNGKPHYGASLKEARENGYLPSITEVDKVLYNYGLEQWKIKQAIMSALTMPRNVSTVLQSDNFVGFNRVIEETTESDAEYIARILDDSRQQARKAAKLGTVIHKLAERYISGKPLFYHGLREDVWTLFEPLRVWIDDNISTAKAEIVIIHHSGEYGGKADLKGIHKKGMKIIADFKSTFMTEKDIKKDGEIKKAKIYDSWGRQLAALWMGSEDIIDELLSVVVSTNKNFPGVWVYKWDFDDLKKHWVVFRNALQIYQIQKGLT